MKHATASLSWRTNGHHSLLQGCPQPGHPGGPVPSPQSISSGHRFINSLRTQHNPLLLRAGSCRYKWSRAAVAGAAGHSWAKCMLGEQQRPGDQGEAQFLKSSFLSQIPGPPRTAVLGLKLSSNPPLFLSGASLHAYLISFHPRETSETLAPFLQMRTLRSRKLMYAKCAYVLITEIHFKAKPRLLGSVQRHFFLTQG